jgi:uncharacterized membrane protein
MDTRLLQWLPVAALVPMALLGSCAKPPPVVSYQADVLPILEKHCKACHVPGQPGYIVSGFDLEGYESLMKGTHYGPVVLPGDALTSTLVMLIEGRASPALKMPHGDAPPMSSDEIRTIRMWVEQGAKNN